jgi:hypothetical protein
MSSLDRAEKQTVSLNRSKAQHESRHRRSVARDFSDDEKWSANSSLSERGAKRDPGSLIVSKTGNNSWSHYHITRYGAGKQKNHFWCLDRGRDVRIFPLEENLCRKKRKSNCYKRPPIHAQELEQGPQRRPTRECLNCGAVFRWNGSTKAE